jgi:hypothetical protein
LAGYPGQPVLRIALYFGLHRFPPLNLLARGISSEMINLTVLEMDGSRKRAKLGEGEKHGAKLSR